MFPKIFEGFQHILSPSEVKILSTLIEKLFDILSETLILKDLQFLSSRNFEMHFENYWQCGQSSFDNAIYLVKGQWDMIKRKPNKGHYY